MTNWRLSVVTRRGAPRPGRADMIVSAVTGGCSYGGDADE